MKKILTVALAYILIFCMSISFVGCKEKKYDVSIRIACDDGGTWVFTPDEDEIRIERNYDGQEHRYYVDAYQLPEHPRWSEKWFSPSGEGADVFDSSYGKVNQRYDEEDPLCICEKGEYYFYVRASDTSNLWNARTIRLYITVM